MALDAARRGARVRLLSDSFFDGGGALRSNRATVDYVRSIAAAEGLDLDARLGNPTGGGIYAKLVLVRVGGETWSAVGSLNGGEVSHKINREVVLRGGPPTGEVDPTVETVKGSKIRSRSSFLRTNVHAPSIAQTSSNMASPYQRKPH